MKIHCHHLVVPLRLLSFFVCSFLPLLRIARVSAFYTPHGYLSPFHSALMTTTTTTKHTKLSVSIGLGPEKQEDSSPQQPSRKLFSEWIPNVDYQVPDHDAYRTSRRSAIDETADAWFQSLLMGPTTADPTDSTTTTTTTSEVPKVGFLGEIAEAARTKLETPIELKNEFLLPEDHEDYTAFVNEKFPWEPLLPAYGLEQFGLPIPRRNADAWRHFDVTGMVSQDYSASPIGIGTDLVLNEEDTASYKSMLMEKGAWLEDDAVTARLVYVNGRFCPQLSLSTESIYNLVSTDLEKDDEIRQYLSRLTDGFTDELAAKVPSGPTDVLTSFSKLSFPNHGVGDPTSQFAINSQQGTACFAALNTIKTGAVALIRSTRCDIDKNVADDDNDDGDEEAEPLKPVLLVNAITRDMACHAAHIGGTFCNPRALVIAEEESRLSLVQSCVDLDLGSDVHPTLYNGYTQIFVKKGAEVSHSYLEETGGVVTGGTELSNNDAVSEGASHPRVVEASRPMLRNTHLEALDVHLIGDDGRYLSTVVSIGGSGRVRIALSVSLLRPKSHASIKGFSLSGGAQRTDMKTNIHHVAQGTTSEQLQKNMIGGRATGAFRGRIRVEQSAQQTASDQLSRTILLSDKCRAWTAPTLEIIADDVQCTHGATVSDLSEEELFYLRSRGLDPTTARNLLMYAFAADITGGVDPSVRGEVDGSNSGLTRRVLDRLENLVPRGDRKVKGQFQSV